MTADAMCHVASAVIDAPEDVAFEHLADAKQLGRWALGCMDLQPTDDPAVFRGRSLFDGSPAFVEIDAKPADGLIDYHVGSSTARAPRIFIRVAPAALCGLPATQCTVALIAWRTADMSAERWRQLCTTHEAEALILKAQIEARFREATSKAE